MLVNCFLKNNFSYFLKKNIVETPANSPHLVWFKDESYHQLEPVNLEINWDPFNLTMNMEAKVEVSLWGYRETTIEPELVYIATLESNVANRGKVSYSTYLQDT